MSAGPVAAQSITSFDPESGNPGTTVRIYGSGFDSTPSNNEVKIGGTSATVTAATPTQLTVEVPTGVTGIAEIDVTVGGSTVTAGRRFVALKASQGARDYTFATPNFAKTQPGAVAWADFDQDGDQDIVIAGTNRDDKSNPHTQLYENTSSGFLERASGIVNVGDPGATLEWGDFDQDGDQDLFVAGKNENLDDSYVAQIYENEGGGSFQAVGADLTGVAEAGAAWGDYDNDGDLDLVVTGERSNGNPSTILYENEGGGTFTPAGAGLTNVLASSADWGDVNNDGRLDLVVTGRNSNFDASTTVYWNRDDGTFQSFQTDVVDVRGNGEAEFGDYDQDGNLDLAVAGRGNGYNSGIYQGDGTGNFTRINADILDVREGPTVEWGDMEGDGDLDLLIAGAWGESGRRETVLYRNVGGTSFVAAEAGLPGVQDADAEWGDMNGDGVLDLALLGIDSENDRVTTVYRSDGDGSPVTSPNFNAQGGVNEVVAKWTESPSEDEDVTKYNVYRLTSEFPSKDPSGLTPIATVETPATSYTDGSVTAGTEYYYRVTAVDSDGFESQLSDRGLATPRASDLTISSFDTRSSVRGTTLKVHGNGFGTTPSNNSVSIGGTSAPVTAATSTELTVEVPAGVTGPAPLSVTVSGVTATAGRRFLALKATQGARNYTATGSNLVATRPGAFAWADYDQDGDQDLLVAGRDRVANSSPPRTRLYENTPSGFLEVGAGLVNVGTKDDFIAGPSATIEWGDFDQDGDPDLYIGGHNDRLPNNTYVARIYENEGDGEFQEVGAGITGRANGAADWGDYDNDGDLDLIVTGRRENDDAGQTTLYRNDGAGEFTPVNAGLTDVWKSSVDWGDVDNDGRLDLIIAGQNNNSVASTTIYRNEGGGSFQSLQTGVPDLTDEGEAEFGDYDQDGNLDLAIAGNTRNSQRSGAIYQGDGTGNFTKLNAGIVDLRGDVAVEWGDMEGDGDLDLLMAGPDPNGNRKTVLYRNVGNTSFVDAEAGLPDVWDVDAEWGDINGDGTLDLALLGSEGGFTNLTAVYRSDGDGSPVVASNLGVASELRDVDLTWTASPSEDGDVVGYNVYRDTAPIDSSAGPSGMTPVATVDTPATSYTDASAEIGTQYHYRVAALDSSDLESGFTAEVTATPIQPLVVSGFTPESGAPDTSVTIYGGGFSTTASENTVTFGSATATVTNATQNSLTVTVPSGVVGPMTLTVEKDGESVTAARRFTALQARTNVRSLTGTDVGLDGLRNGSVALGDLDGDNHIDVAMVGEGAGGTPTTRLYENNGDGTYTAMDAGLTGVTDGSVALGDLDGDNHLDVVIAGNKDDGTPVTKIYSNDGSGAFTEINTSLTGVRNGSVALGDLNGDNRIDLAITGTNASGTPTTTLYSNDGGGSFTAMNAGLTDLTNGSVALGDLNGDNHIDVALLGEQADGTPTTRLYQNDGSGSFSALSSLTGRTNGSVALGDLNGNNMLDVAVVGEEAGGTPTTTLYTNDGGGSFSAMNAGLTGVRNGSVLLGDLNGNNRIDIALSGTDADGNGVLNAYRNTPDGWTAVGPGPITFVPQRGGMAFGDAEGDGDLDLVAVGNGVGSESTPGAGVFENVYPTPSGVTASAGTGEAALDWQKTTGSQLATYPLYRSTAPIDSLGDPSGLTPFDSVSAGTTSYTDADLDEGQTYYYRVTAVAETGEGSPLSAQNYAFLYPGSVTADVTRSFDDASSAEDYRLVALPGQVDRPLESTLDGEAGTEWQAYWDDGSDSDFLRRFDGSEAFTLERGRGFWLTSQSDWTVEDSIETVDLKNDTSTTVPLNSGWTIISNPLEKSVDWTLVERANGGGLQPLWEFGGTFTQAQNFASAATGTAYYFFNDTGKDSLTVPYPGAPQFREVPKTGQAKKSMLALSAQSARDDGPASTVRVGIAGTEDARQSIIAPPGRFAETSLRIEAPGETDSKRGRTLMAERRPRGDEPGQTFRLRLTHRADGPVQLTAEHLGAIDGRAVALLHPSAGKTYDLREEETVEIEPEAETTELKVAIGTDSYVKDQTDKVLPDEVTLTSYPNPARQQGTVEYALPEKTEVTFRLYDVLGREVATIAQGRKTAGRHRVQLEVGRLASGVYFGRLQVGDQTLTQKITVVR